MSETLKVLKNNVALEQQPLRERKYGSLFIAETEIDNVINCKVLAIGREVIGLEVNDTVLVKIGDSSPIVKWNGKKIRFYKATDILAKLT